MAGSKNCNWRYVKRVPIDCVKPGPFIQASTKNTTEREIAHRDHDSNQQIEIGFDRLA